MPERFRDLAELFRMAFLRGAECEAELRGGAEVLTSQQDAEDAWQQAMADALEGHNPPPPKH
jgi:hypothetical protein